VWNKFGEILKEEVFISFEVTSPLSLTDQMELICPVAIAPGEYFSCIADFPNGLDLQATVTMEDNLTGESESTETMDVPSMLFKNSKYSFFRR
jgi:hypothetical protein